MGGRSAAVLAAALWFGLVAGRGCALAHPRASDGLLGVALAAVLAAGLVAWRLARRHPADAAPAARRASRAAAVTLLVVATFLAGFARGGGHVRTLERGRALVREGDLLRFEAVVEEPPGVATARPLVMLRVERSHPPLAPGARVRVRFPEGADAEWGDRVRGLAELALPRDFRNPGGWDARAGADASSLVAGGRAIVLERVDGRLTWLRSTVVRWRRGVERRLAAGLGAEARELVLPLVTGDRGALPTELAADFRASGLVHLLALSGLHVSALAAVARTLAASAGGGVGARAVAGVVAAVLYVGLAGPLPSLMRAAVTESWLAAARIARRAGDPVQALAVTAIALLAVMPGWAHDLGFQLSCAASLGLALVAPWSAGLSAVARLGWAPVAGTLAAQALCAPILMARLHGLAWPALAANLVAVPLCGLLLAAAWLAVAAETAYAGAGHLFFSACEALSRMLVAVTAAAARWPASLAATGHEPGLLALAHAGAAALAVAAAAPRDLESRSRRWTPGREALALSGALALALAITLAVATPELRPPPGATWLVALDVGQGDATAVADGAGWWLVDAGPRSPQHDAGEGVVRPFLRWAAIRELRALALTHADGDHIGGARAVRRGVRVERVIGPDVPGPPPGLDWRAARGETLFRFPPAVALWPPRGGSPLAARGDNAAGLVLELSRGDVRALLPADVDSLVEEQLAFRGPVALLKAGHHGSASSSGGAFLARARPAVAWISAGARNAYGHPSPLALARLARAGARVDRTDLDGALWYELTARGVRRLDWRRGEPERRAGPGEVSGTRPAARAPRRE